MEDKMKKFIENNKDEFDFELPSEDSWNKIAKEIPSKKKGLGTIWFMRIAAAIVLLVGAVGVLKVMQDDTSPDIATTHPVQVQSAVLGDFSSDMQEVEQFYISQVSQHQEELVNYTVDQDLLEEIDLLKEEYEELKLEMGQAVDPGKVVEAMIANYEMRLEILKDILDAMKQEKSTNAKSHKDENLTI